MPHDDARMERLSALLAERYEFLRFLGQGGFAAVYQVRSRGLDRLEALKVLLASHEDDPEFAGRFQQEARLAASLDHPNIVRIWEFGHVGTFWWYSMQFVDGPTLTGELAHAGPMDERRAAALAAPLCDALAYAHAQGIVHRDVKPDNVILGPTGRPYLTDFGIAKTANSLVKTQSGLILGSPAFLAPEQVRGEPPDGRSDVYALGVTLYQMVSGKRPFTAEDRTKLMIARLREDPMPLEAARPGIDPAFAALVMRCLARDRGPRPTASEVRDALLLLLDRSGGRPLEARLSGEVAAPARGGASAEPTLVTAPAPTAGTGTLPTAALRTAPPPVPVATAATVAAPPMPVAPAAVPAPRRAKGALAALGVLAAAAVAAALWWRGRTPAVPAPVLAPATAPTAVPLAAPTAAPPPAPTATPAPEAAATPAPARGARAAAPAHEAPPRAPAPEPALPARRAFTQAAPLDTPPVSLPADVAAEYAGKSTGIVATIGEDGLVKAARVISPVAPPCAQCDAAALEAAKRARYTPAKDREGNPVESKVAVAVPF